MKPFATFVILMLMVISTPCLSASVGDDVVDQIAQAYDDLGPFSVKLRYAYSCSMEIQDRQLEATGSVAIELWQSDEYTRLSIVEVDAGGQPYSSDYTTMVTDRNSGLTHCLNSQGEWITEWSRFDSLLDVLGLTEVKEFDSIEEANWEGLSVWVLKASVTQVNSTFYVDRANRFVRRVTLEATTPLQEAKVVWNIDAELPQIGVPDGVFDLDAIKSE